MRFVRRGCCVARIGGVVLTLAVAGCGARSPLWVPDGSDGGEGEGEGEGEVPCTEDCPDGCEPGDGTGDELPAQGCPGVLEVAATGRIQMLTVPMCASSLEVKLWGAAGGSTGPASGAGGYVHHEALAVTPGERLEIIVGGGGDCLAGGQSGGFGGGGSGTDHPVWVWSCGGGGRTAIRRAGQDIATAGGGGGTGYPIAFYLAEVPTGPGGAGCGGGEDGRGQDGGGPGESERGGGFGGRLDSGGPGGTEGDTPGNPGSRCRGGDGLPHAQGSSGGGGGGAYGGGGGAHTMHYVSGAGGGGSCLVPDGGGFQGGDHARPAGQDDPDWNGVAGAGASGAVLRGNPGLAILRW